MFLVVTYKFIDETIIFFSFFFWNIGNAPSSITLTFTILRINCFWLLLSCIPGKETSSGEIEKREGIWKSVNCYYRF